MRRLCVVALALLLAATVAGSASSKTGRPLTLDGALELSLGELSLGGNGHGQTLRYVAGQKFAVGIALTNPSRTRIVLTGAGVIEPPRTLIHQIGARFHGLRSPTCVPDALGCPATPFLLHARAWHPRPFAVTPQNGVGVELDFRLGSCTELANASSKPVSRLSLTFRKGGGRPQHLVLALAYAALHVKMPKRCPLRG